MTSVIDGAWSASLMVHGQRYWWCMVCVIDGAWSAS